MKTSESITKIAGALLKAQQAITFAAKDTANPFFKSKYADLPAVINAVKPALNEAGIVFVQMLTPSDPGTLSMTTRLLHESGEWIESEATMPLAKVDPQGYGSATTYLRRYSLASAAGLYQDDDDGNGASGVGKKEIHPEDDKDVWKGFSPQMRSLIEKVSQACIAHFQGGNEWGAWEEYSGLLARATDKLTGEIDADKRNRLVLAADSIFNRHSALKNYLKKQSANEFSSKETA